MNLEDIFSIGTHGLNFAIGELEGGTGQFSAFGSAMWINIDMNEVAVQSQDEDNLNELATTIIHELNHAHGHVQGLGILNSGIGIEAEVEVTTSNLTAQLMYAIAAAGIYIIPDKGGC